MRFGFATIPSGPPDQTLALVRHAEALGFDVAWMPDQTFNRDPYLTLGACAHHTERITLGLGVTNPYTRHPAMTARAAATLAEICDGRFILGIGAGNRKELINLLGLPADAAGARCREMASTVKRLLAGETVTHESRTLTLRQVALEIAPAPPPIPVYLAARGPQILAAAGEVADGVIIGALVSDAGLEFALTHVRAGAQRVGRSLDGFEVVSWVLTVVTDRKDEIVHGLRPMVAHIVGGAPTEVLDAIGMTQARIDEFKRAYAEGGPTGAAPLVDPALVEQLTIVGDAVEVAGRIGRLAKAGVTQLAVLMPSGGRGSHAMPDFDHRGNLERIARHVRPQVRGA